MQPWKLGPANAFCPVSIPYFPSGACQAASLKISSL
jgi:hypothetical protein